MGCCNQKPVETQELKTQDTYVETELDPNLIQKEDHNQINNDIINQENDNEIADNNKQVLRSKKPVNMPEESENEEDIKSNKEEPIKEDPKKYENFDWKNLLENMPYQKTEEERNKRINIWNKGLNAHGNGSISLKKIMKDLTKYLNIPKVVMNYNVVRAAYNAAKNKVKNKKSNISDNYLQFSEFRIFLVYLRQYFEYWVMFQRIDLSENNTIEYDEFLKAIPTMNKWGVFIDNPEAAFKEIDTNNDNVLSFTEFCDFAISRSLDLEDDDDFDDEAILMLNQGQV